MLRIKSLLIASASVLATAVSISAFAGGPTTEMPAVDNSVSGFTLGSNLATLNGATSFALLGGYVNDQFLADLGVNYNSTTVTIGGLSKTAHVTNLRGDLGLRYQLMQELFATYGATGSYGVLSNSVSGLKAPYTVGAFVGLDYQPLRHILLSFKVSPYTYARSVYNTTSNNVFSDGSIGASYIFS